ncbi:MAG TPA: hypothetical protein VFS00_02425, partial [Polyangiaceae bacterium]|nr:hypothetical protein [Polyangiaceae bacterium]
MARAVPAHLRLAARVVAFEPAVALFLMLRPPNFADQALVKLSTSQWVAVLTGSAAAVAYGIFYDAARAHPKRAMALGLEAFYAKYGRPGGQPLVPVEVETAAPKKPGKKRKKAAAAAAGGVAAGAAGVAAGAAADETAGETAGVDEADKAVDAPAEAPPGPDPDKGLEPA